MNSQEGILRVIVKFTCSLMKALGRHPHIASLWGRWGWGVLRNANAIICVPRDARSEQMGIFNFLKFDWVVKLESWLLSGDWAGLTSDEFAGKREMLAFVFGTLKWPSHGVVISFSFPFLFLRLNYDVGNPIPKSRCVCVCVIVFKSQLKFFFWCFGNSGCPGVGRCTTVMGLVLLLPVGSV